MVERGQIRDPYTWIFQVSPSGKAIMPNKGTDVVYTALPAGQYGVMSLDTISKDEIKERPDYSSVNSSTEPFETFIVALAGRITSMHIYANDGGTYPTSSSSITSVDVYIKLVQSGVTTRTAFTRATHGTNPTSGYTDFTYTNTVTPNVGFNHILFQKHFRRSGDIPVD